MGLQLETTGCNDLIEYVPQIKSLLVLFNELELLKIICDEIEMFREVKDLARKYFRGLIFYFQA
jgi:hypothetical protein